jgi:hypothetical protein
MPRPLIAVAAALCALVSSGCGGGGGSTSTNATAEAAQPAAKLPAHWRRHLDRRGGLTIGVPPGWKAHQPRRGFLISSPDRLVAISIAADRTAAARALPLDRFARAASPSG